MSETRTTEPESAAARAGAMLRLLDRPVSDDDLALGARRAAQEVDTRARATVGVLIFRLDDEMLAVPAKSLRRVTTYARPSSIPHRRSGVLKGVCSVRGELVLCADLRRLLGLTPRATPQSPPETGGDARRMVVIGPPEASWVFEVDSLVGIERIDTALLLAPPVTVEHALGAFVAGLADTEHGRVTVLDEKRVLSGLEAGLT